MALELIRADFNTTSLANSFTLADLKQQRIELRAGMRCVFYDFDVEDDVSGFLHGIGEVWWDEKSNQYRIDLLALSLEFTPGSDLSGLRACYSV